MMTVDLKARLLGKISAVLRNHNSYLEIVQRFINEAELATEYENDTHFLEDVFHSDNKSFFTISSKESFNTFVTDEDAHLPFIYTPLNDHSRVHMHRGDLVFCYRQGQFGSLDEALRQRGIYGLGIVASDPQNLFPDKQNHEKYGVLVILPFAFDHHLELREIQLNPSTINLTPYNGNRNDALQYIESPEHIQSLLEMIARCNPNKRREIELVSGRVLKVRKLPSEIWGEHDGEGISNSYCQIIFFGAPGTGKSHEIKKQTADQSVVRTTFHPDSDYSTFVGAYKPTTIDVPLRDVSGHVVVENGDPVIESKIVYEFVEQAFLKAYVNAWTLLAENKPQFLIVEEINRGNCAQIFGDLFQLLDRNDFGFSDYPITADKDLQKHLKKAFENLNISGTDIEGEYEESNDSIAAKVKSGEVLLLPKNLYIWATMNTSDQSLFPIDSAFKRRWDWKYIPISKGFDENGQEIKLAIEGCIKKYSWWSFLEKINVQVGDATQSEDKKLGFFFCKGSAGTISADKFVSKVIFYLWNDVFKNNGFEGDLFKDVDGTVLSFDKFYTSDANGKVSVRKDKVELFLKNLGVEEFGCVTPGDDYLPEVDEDGNNANNSAKDYSRYTINGNGSYSKGSVVLEAVKQYIADNPNKSAEDIVHDWLALEVNVPNFVETQTTFNERRQRSRDSRIDQKAKTTSMANGETIYVSNQYNLERISDVIMKVNGANWGITISKI